MCLLYNLQAESAFVDWDRPWCVAYSGPTDGIALLPASEKFKPTFEHFKDVFPKQNFTVTQPSSPKGIWEHLSLGLK